MPLEAANVGEALAAVVAGEEDQGVLLLPGAVAAPQHLADERSRSSTISRVLLDGAAVVVRGSDLAGSPALIRAAISAPASVSPSAIQGQCGVVKLRLSSHGLSWSRPMYSLARSVRTAV